TRLEREPYARGDPAHEPAPVGELDHAVRPGTKLARLGADRRAGSLAHEDEPHAGRMDRLRHVAAVRQDELERPCASGAPDAQAADRDRPDDAAWRADDDHDADAHPDRHTGRAPRPRREENQRVVVTGLDATRQTRRDG